MGRGGGFVLVVGPSGAGKDTLIGLARRALAGDGRFLFPRRVVTRPSTAAEEHDTLDEAAFAAAEAAGAFCLSWRAHGLRYGIPAAAEAAARAEGALAVCNVSRAVVAAARVRLPAVGVVEVTAPPEVLARRLALRAREADGDVAARLARAAAAPDCGPPDLRIPNAGAPEAAAAALLRHLRARVEAHPCPP
jgi:ribose 1,5-bisphosphokinase